MKVSTKLDTARRGNRGGERIRYHRKGKADCVYVPPPDHNISISCPTAQFNLIFLGYSLRSSWPSV
jgi:hypothetical protein